MEFGNDNILQTLERPPNKNNITIYGFIQIALMIILGCWVGISLFKELPNFKLHFYILLSIFAHSIIFVGFIFSLMGFISEKSAQLKTGFLLYFFGCILLLIKDFIDIFKFGISFLVFIQFIIALLLSFVILKQIQHI